MYTTPVLNTPLTQLRKNAAGYVTAQKVVAHLRRHGMKRAISTVTAFERGQFADPDPEFMLLYAAAIGARLEDVRTALLKTQRMRKRGTGPFDANPPRAGAR